MSNKPYGLKVTWVGGSETFHWFASESDRKKRGRELTSNTRVIHIGKVTR